MEDNDSLSSERGGNGVRNLITLERQQSYTDKKPNTKIITKTSAEKRTKMDQGQIEPAIVQENAAWGTSIEQVPMDSSRIYYQNINGLKIGQQTIGGSTI
jgi:hypothetical protein